MLLSDIQKAFTDWYPFLKIEFSKEPVHNGQAAKQKKILPESLIQEVTNAGMPVILDMSGNRTIAEIERDCMETLSLRVRVSRKSGNVWTPITLTENWTLENQNDAGKFISAEMDILPIKE
ncbi:MAG TPA: hypothetical protein PL045_06540 [Chitinophagaceae bacterium]|nr:hypothetical protein [Chitinophagaceae bacterium]